MNVDMLFQQIETREIEFQLGVASGFTTFQRIVQEIPVYQELNKAVADKSIAKQVIEHMVELINQKVDPQYSHPSDTFLAVYALAIINHHPDLLRFLLSDNISPHGLYWTRYAAQRVANLLTVE